MSVCAHCDGEMTEGISCRPDPIAIGGEAFEPIRWGDEGENRSRARRVDFNCSDCCTPPGGVHHRGCRVERCPACLGQALGCPCVDDPDPFRVRRRSRCTAHLLPRHYRT
jgi:hypothetical protein